MRGCFGADGNMSRNITLRNAQSHLYKDVAPRTVADITWLVLFQGQQACIHQTHICTDESALDGPIVFCCPKAFHTFHKHFSNHHCLSGNSIKDDQIQDVLREISADQIISWLDAGIQVIHFVVCDQESDEGISGAVLSGKQARQVLKKEQPLEPFLSNSTLNSIGFN